MGILQIRPAKRGNSKCIIAIAGVSGSGKTFTALLLARGMVENANEIGFLDTENGRGSLYGDILDGEFQIADLHAPFSPNRYSEAIREFQDAGVKVLVIDSCSHEWEGFGGCEDIANAPLENGGRMADWKNAKKQHKNFMNVLLQSNMHIICCIRARDKTDFKNPKMPVSLGLQPICEKNFMFEMTASMMMHDEGKRQEFQKVPSFLRRAFGNGGDYIGIDTGKAIIKWINEGDKENPEVTRLKSEMQMSCQNGVEALGKVWQTVPKELQPLLFDYKETCKASALEYELQAKAAAHFEGASDGKDEAASQAAAAYNQSQNA